VPVGVELGKVGFASQLRQPRKGDDALNDGRGTGLSGGGRCQLRRSDRTERDIRKDIIKIFFLNLGCSIAFVDPNAYPLTYHYLYKSIAYLSSS